MKFSETIGEFDGKLWDKLSVNEKNLLIQSWATDPLSEIGGVVDYIYSVNYDEVKAYVIAVALTRDVGEAIAAMIRAAVNRQVMFEYERERKMAAGWLAKGVSAL